VSKIIPALQSRCTKFRFAPLLPQQIEPRVLQICHAENISIDEGGVKVSDVQTPLCVGIVFNFVFVVVVVVFSYQALIALSAGDMRKILNILQATHMSFGKVESDLVYQTTGQPLPADINTILNDLLNENTATAYAKVSELKTVKGLALEVNNLFVVVVVL
jgi:replication factor C subunit 3/5